MIRESGYRFSEKIMLKKSVFKEPAFTRTAELAA